MRKIKFPILLYAVAGSIWPATESYGSTAEVTTAVLIGAAVLSTAAAYFLRPRPKTDSSSEVNGTPTSLSERGSTAPVINGFRRIPLIFAGTWDRRVEEIVQETEQSGGGKGMFGGGSGGQQTTTIYYESGLHVLLTGPVNRLHRILDRGEVVWAGPIDSISTPSGSSVTTKIGTFYVYWGETDQPPNPRLAEAHRLGVLSRWPGYCYMEWVDANLGDQPTWKPLEYEMSVDSVGPGLTKSKQYLVETDPAAKNSGINYAHSVYQLLTAAWPLGMGKAPSTIDFESLEELGIRCEQENTPCNWIADGSSTVGDVLTNLMSDHDFFMYQRGDKVGFKSIRPSSGPVFSLSQLASDAPSVTYPQGASPVSSTAFFIQSRTQAFSRVEVRSLDSGEYAMNRRRKSSDINLETVIDGVTGGIIADRKEAQAFSSQAIYRLDLTGPARKLLPGGVFVMETMGPLRVISNKLDTSSMKCQVTCTYDSMSEAATGYVRPPTIITEVTADPIPDLEFRPIEVPYNFASDRIILSVLRARGGPAMGAADVQTSVGGSSYTVKGSQASYAIAGNLQEPFLQDTNRIVESGPSFSALNGDVTQALDLSGDRASWLAGKQAILVDDEIMFVERLEAEPGGFRFINVVRGRCGTAVKAHAAGARIWLFSSSSLTGFSDAAYQLGTTIEVKSVPAGIDASEIPAVPLEVQGVALSPWAPSKPVVLRFSNLPSLVLDDSGTDWVEVQGLYLERFKPGQYVSLFEKYPKTSKGFYLLKSVEVVGGNTRLTFATPVEGSLTLASTFVNLAKFSDRQDSDFSEVYLAWAFCNRSDLSASGRQGYGAGGASRPNQEGDFVISFYEAGVLRNEVISPIPFYKDTTTFLGGSATITVKVANRIGGYVSHQSERDIQQE